MANQVRIEYEAVIGGEGKTNAEKIASGGEALTIEVAFGRIAAVETILDPTAQRSMIGFFAELARKVDGDVGYMQHFTFSKTAQFLATIVKTPVMKYEDAGDLILCHGIEKAVTIVSEFCTKAMSAIKRGNAGAEASQG
jgi:hypothetical protein